MIIKLKNFNEAVKNVNNALSKDKNRPMFMGVHLKTDDVTKELVFEATNGFVLNTSRVPIEEDYFEIDMVIKGLTCVGKEKGYVEITPIENGIKINNTIYEALEGQFLDTKTILDKSSVNKTLRIGIDPRYLEMAIKDLKIKGFDGGKNNPIYPIVLNIDVDNLDVDQNYVKTIIITNETKGTQSKNLVCPMRLNR